MIRIICLDRESYKVVIREDNEEYHFKPHYVMVTSPYDASLIGPFLSSNHAVEWSSTMGDHDFDTHILSQTEMEDNIREHGNIPFYSIEDFTKFLKEATELE